MTKLLIGLLGAVVLGTGGYAAAAGLDDAEPARTVSLPGATTSDDAGLTTGTTTTAATTTVEDDIVAGNPSAATGTIDISGPCDETEHANDPRCTGADGAELDEDNSGPGSGNDDNDDDDDHDDDHGGDDDRSGSNSGSHHDD
jgi:hypothetical protein